MSTRSQLSARAGLGLAAHLLGVRASLGDVRLFAMGRLHLWPGWPHARAEDRTRIVRFLNSRADAFGEDGPLFQYLRREVDAGNDFEVGPAGYDPAARWNTTFRPAAGRPLVERLDEWLDELELLPAHLGPRPVTISGGSDVELVGHDRAFRVPHAHLPNAPKPLQLETQRAVSTISLDEAELRALARRIDGAGGIGPRYEEIAVDGFFAEFRQRDGRSVTSLQAGPTALGVAPTGTGKSVFARLLALHLAVRSGPVALVVPDIQTAWKEAIRLEAAARCAALSLRVVPLSSWRQLAHHLAGHLAHPPVDDKDAQWAIDRIGYACLLGAYAEPEVDAPAPGAEPCMRLRQRVQGRRKMEEVHCPFAQQCGRFATFATAVDADILVVNHHAFLAGRVPLEVSVDGSPRRKVSTAEFVLRRCMAVIVDEIDALQDRAIGAGSRGLVLSSRAGLSKPIQLYTEVEQRRAENRLPPNLRFERGRSALLRIMNEAERLSELVNRKELEWPERGRMTWREAHDAWIAARLYPGASDGLERVRRVFDRDAVAGADPNTERLRKALAPLAGPGLGDGTLMEEIRVGLMSVLINWTGSRKHEELTQRERSKLVDRLIVRAILLQVDTALEHLRPQLPEFEQHEIQPAADLRDSLLGFASWQPSPTGPLGQRLFGYAFAQRADEQGALETHVLAGDPHGLVRELGGLVAHVLADTPRIVLGLSATCRFRGAPRADVLGDLAGAVRDPACNVSVIQAAVKARISGIGSRAERLDAARQAAQELWATTLETYLQERARDPKQRGRARALLVTGSYDEAAAVAHGLRQVAGSATVIRYLVRDGADAHSDDAVLPRRQIETFGHATAPAVLVAPLNVVARGHNILQPGTQLSALSGIFVLTRPVPPSHDADRFLAHLSYNARLSPPAWRGTANETIGAERNEAWRRLRALQRSPATFRHMDRELRLELVCDVLVELAQLAGRARRGGTAVDLVFVDGAFQDEVVPWRDLVHEVMTWWKKQGWLEEMIWLHGAFLRGLADYAGFALA